MGVSTKRWSRGTQRADYFSDTNRQGAYLSGLPTYYLLPGPFGTARDKSKERSQSFADDGDSRPMSCNPGLRLQARILPTAGADPPSSTPPSESSPSPSASPSPTRKAPLSLVASAPPLPKQTYCCLYREDSCLVAANAAGCANNWEVFCCGGLPLMRRSEHRGSPPPRGWEICH